MPNDDKTKDDLLVEEALNELLSLSDSKKNQFESSLRRINKPVSEPVYQNHAPKEVKLTGLAAVIANAKKMEHEINKDMWDDPVRAREEALTKKIKEQKKSAYDSDVLRERILRRQAEKRGFDPLEGIRTAVAKNKKDFEDD